MQQKTKERIIYLVSGPIGVGKSTTTKVLADKLDRCALIEGDHLLHMFKWEAYPTWEQRLNLSWMNIVAIARNIIEHDFNVVIDFVVEDEFDWFCEQISDLNVRLVYVVLRADQETLLERLNKRGDNLDSIKRSLFLLNKLENSPANSKFMFDTTNWNPADVAEEIIHNPNFIV